MLRLDITNQNTFTLTWNNEGSEKPILLITKDGKLESTSSAEATKTKTCKEGSVPTSPVFKQTQKVILENDGIEKITVERIEENNQEQTGPWSNKWTFKLSQGEITRMFRAPTPDAVLAYEYYFQQVKMDVLRGQLR